MKYIKRMLSKCMNCLKRLFKEVIGVTFFLCKNTIALIGTEDFGNLGDHHIAVSELEFIRTYFKNYRCLEIGAKNYYNNIKIYRKYIKNNTLIFLHGGGNMGEEYGYSENLRQKTVKMFPDNYKFIFPQTIDYKKLDGKIFADAIETYTTDNKVSLFCREEASYEFAKKHMKCKVYLVPDIVLFSKRDSQEKKDSIALCFRNDVEKVLNESEREKIYMYAKRLSDDVYYTDTQLKYHVNIRNREKTLRTFMRDLSKNRLVITDRLHGMVFCAITKTPCIVMSNYNHKVNGVYQWINSLKFIYFAKDLYNIEEVIKKYYDLDNRKLQAINLIDEFNKMQLIIKGID